MFFVESKKETPRFKNPRELLKHMDFIKYDPHNTDNGPNRWRLRTAEQTEEDKSGDCHDQTYYALQYLKEMKLNPKCLFMIEYSGDVIENAGTTHSIVYYEQNGKLYWFEHAWQDERGIHGPYKSTEDLKSAIKDKWNHNDKYPNLYIGTWKNVKPGMDLNELAVACIPDRLLEE